MRWLAVSVVALIVFCDVLAEFPPSCDMPMDPGLGDDITVLLYYDKAQDKCLPFHYGGKGGNENRFFTDRMCMQNCSSSGMRLYPADEKEACHLPKDYGHCMGRYLVWYYDSIHGKCKTFRFTGCGGNGNRFLSEHHCNTTCAGIFDQGDMEKEVQSYTPAASCDMPMDPGLGDDITVLLYYDKAQNKCLPFHYKGRGGNENRFYTDRMCMQNCSSRAEELYPADEKKACHLTKEFGHCMGRYLLWYYDPIHGKCKTFRFSGCGGNGNRFLSEHHCNTTCAGIIDQGDMEEEVESDTPAGLIIGIVLGVLGAVTMIVTVVMVVKNKKPKETKKVPKGDDSPLQPEGMEMA